jgi:CitMHS family citrate-Mg2+:H+ or citrate-Ca2+:H+ symporter
MIAVFMVLIMTKKLTPVLALIIVPTVFGLFAGAGLGIGDMVMDSMKSMTSTAALLMFAIIYFGLMIDVGLFDPLVKFILRKLGNDPAKVVLGTAMLAAQSPSTATAPPPSSSPRPPCCPSTCDSR